MCHEHEIDKIKIVYLNSDNYGNLPNTSIIDFSVYPSDAIFICLQYIDGNLMKQFILSDDKSTWYPLVDHSKLVDYYLSSKQDVVQEQSHESKRISKD